jgi:hypothetical protein
MQDFQQKAIYAGLKFEEILNRTPANTESYQLFKGRIFNDN